MKKIIALFCIGALFLLFSEVNGQFIYEYTNNTSGNPNSVAANATGGNLTRENGATAPGSPCSTGFSSTSHSTSATYSTSHTAVQVILSANSGYSLSVTGFSVGLRRSGSGPQSARLAYSVDGGVTWIDKGSDDSPNNAGCGTTTTATWTTSVPTTSIRFRVYLFNSGTGNSQILNLYINGTVVPTAPSFSFAASATSIAENGANVSVVVNQSTAAVCNVNVVRIGGTAVPSVEFTFSSPTTLNFDGTSTTQTINIPIIDDFVADGNKTIILELQSPTGGCSIGSLHQITITIIDDEISPSTILEPGDVMIVGVDAKAGGCEANHNVDVIEWICFKNITTGTTIDITDNGYSASTGFWRNSEGTVRATYNGPGITAGTKIVFKTYTSGDLPTAPDWSFSNINFPGTSLALNIDGDQLYFMQGGTWNMGTSVGSADASYVGGKFLFAFSTNSAWNDFEIPPYSSNKSQHSSLYPNMRCFSAAPTSATDWSRYNGVITAATQREWIDRVKNPSNWTSYSSCTNWAASPFPASVTINPGTMVSGKWLGGFNSNWFDCNNWDDFRVPDNTTDVSIELTTGNNPTIDATASYSDEFSDIAQARKLTIASSTNRTLTFPASGTHTLEVYGNWDNQKGQSFFTEGNGSVHFRGGLNQTITTQGGVERFYNIVFNKTGGNVTLNSTNAEISGSATFTAGRVNAPNATTARMEFLDNATTTGANNNSYVNGWVRKVGNDAFVFPVGDDGFYAPIAISAPANTTDHFTATYDRVYPTPYSILSKDPTLDHVGNCEHWILNRTNGTSNVFVELSYDNTRSCGITTGQESALRVARWDGAVWRDHGNTTATLIPTNAIRSGAAISSFSPFTLASANSFNPLPLELLTFKGKINHKGEAELTWQTASELNIAGFEVEKSTDNREFRKIGFVNAKNANLNAYSFIDKDFAGLSYYRLRVVETNKTFRYSQTISLDKTKAVQLLIYPNPASEKDFVRVALGARNEINSISIQILSQTGKILAEVVGNLETTETQLTEKLQNLPKGLYIIRLQTENGEMLTAKFVKQ
jgi:hypothetical protein